jgi:uncharacterized repeat protein (TIGR02543 family)
VAVYVTNVTNLNAFSVRLKIVSNKYSADSVKEEISGRTNILKFATGANALFIKSIESDKIEIAGTIGTSKATPETEGLLGVFYFTSKLGWNDSVDIEIYDAVLTSITGGGDEDIFPVGSGSFHKGTYSVIQPHTVTFNAGSNGDVNGQSQVVQTVLRGNDCTPVTANASTGYHFNGWTGGMVSSDNPLTITNVTSNITVTANFAINTYTLTVNSDGNGTATGSGTVNHGVAHAITATPNTGYDFVNWTV